VPVCTSNAQYGALINKSPLAIVLLGGKTCPLTLSMKVLFQNIIKFKPAETSVFELIVTKVLKILR
jgi:hypothetical protein